mmetsp:Transcript_4012/g.6154  ORF Transcript_4012/g.6154 Transcript_4012/m.6154 type:complete len:540 (+) Transcript_4012:50-1669(+)
MRLSACFGIALLGNTSTRIVLGWSKELTSGRSSFKLLKRYSSSINDDEMCTIKIPCKLIRRAEASVGDDPKKLEVYLTEALGLGLGVLERADLRDAEAARIAREFEALSSRLIEWENSLKVGIETKSKEVLGTQERLLERYLGERGELERQTKHLTNELVDETRESSVPARTARAVSKSLDETISQLRAAIDVSDSQSQLGKFVIQSRNEANEFRNQIVLDLKIFNQLKEDLQTVTDKAKNIFNEEEAIQKGESSARGKQFEEIVSQALVDLAKPFNDYVSNKAQEKALGSKSKVGDLSIDFALPYLGEKFQSEEDSLTLNQKDTENTMTKNNAPRPPRMAIEVKSGKFTWTGSNSLENQIRLTMKLHECDVGLGVVRADFLPKRFGWYTNLRDDVVIVAYDQDIKHGNVALYCAYKSLRAKAIADYVSRRAFAYTKHQQHLDKQLAHQRADTVISVARKRSVQIQRRCADVLGALEKLVRMKTNIGSMSNMLEALRQDLNSLEREVKEAIAYLEADLKPLHDLTSTLEHDEDIVVDGK